MEENILTETSRSYATFDYATDHALSIKSILIYAILMYGANFIIQIALILLTPIITGNPVYMENELGEVILHPESEMFINSWTQFLIYLAMFIGLMYYNYKGLLKDLIWFKHEPKQQLTNIIMGIGLFLGAMIISSMFLTLLGLDEVSENQAQIENMMSGKYASIVIVAIVIFGPICEELIFRKSFFNIFKEDTKDWVKIVLSGTIFGFIHVAMAIASYIAMGENIITILTEFLLGIPYIIQGITLSYIYYKSERNILPVTIIHILNNLYATIMVLLMVE